MLIGIAPLALARSRIRRMGAPDPVVYRLLTELLPCVLGHVRQRSLRAVADLVWALLAAQSLHPADLGRALPDLRTGRARQALRRVRRVVGRPLLRSPGLTPLLVERALQRVADAEVTLVLDSTRCGRWEIFTVSVLYAGRVLPLPTRPRRRTRTVRHAA